MLTCINYKQKPSTMFQNCKQPLLFTFFKIKSDVAKPKKNVETKLLDLQWMKPWIENFFKKGITMPHNLKNSSHPLANVMNLPFICNNKWQ